MSSLKKLKKIEHLMAAGKSFEIKTLDGEDAPIVQHFLRHYRGEYLKIHSQISTSASNLENLRNYIKIGNLDKARYFAEQLLKEDLDEEFTGELKLELARISNIQGKYLEGLQYTVEALASTSISSLSRMTLHQLRADLFLKIEDFQNAEMSARQAVIESKPYPGASSRFSALGFLAIILAQNGNIDEAKYYLDQLYQAVMSIEQDILWIDRMLIYSRTAFRLNFITNDKQESWRHLQFSKELANWTGELEIYQRCISDEQYFSLDRTNWSVGVWKKNQFMWIPDICALFDFQKKIIYRFTKSPIQAKLLTFQFSGETDPGVIFKSIWGLSYDKERHSGLLRTHLYHLRKRVKDLKDL